MSTRQNAQIGSRWHQSTCCMHAHKCILYVAKSLLVVQVRLQQGRQRLWLGLHGGCLLPAHTMRVCDSVSLLCTPTRTMMSQVGARRVGSHTSRMVVSKQPPLLVFSSPQLGNPTLRTRVHVLPYYNPPVLSSRRPGDEVPSDGSLTSMSGRFRTDTERLSVIRRRAQTTHWAFISKGYNHL